MTHTRSKMTPDDGALDQKWQHVEGGGIRHGGLTLRLAHTASRADGGDALGAYTDSCDCEIQRDEPAAGLREGILFCPLHEAATDVLAALKALGQTCAHCEWWHAQSCTHWEARDECQANCAAARAAIAKARGE